MLTYQINGDDGKSIKWRGIKLKDPLFNKIDEI